jgi:hypothetical protein
LHDSDGFEGDGSSEDVELLMTPAEMTPAPVLSPGSPVAGSPRIASAGDDGVTASPTELEGQTKQVQIEEEEALLPWARPRWGPTTAPVPCGSPSSTAAEDIVASPLTEASDLAVASSSDEGSGDVVADGDASRGTSSCESCCSDVGSVDDVGVSTDPYGEPIDDDGENPVAFCDPYDLLEVPDTAEGTSGAGNVASDSEVVWLSGAAGIAVGGQPLNPANGEEVTAIATDTSMATPPAVQHQKQAPPRPKRKVALSFVDAEGEDADSGF